MSAKKKGLLAVFIIILTPFALCGLAILSRWLWSKTPAEVRWTAAYRKAYDVIEQNITPGLERDEAIARMDKLGNWIHVVCTYHPNSVAEDYFYFAYENHIGDPHITRSIPDVHGKFIIDGLYQDDPDSICILPECAPPDIDQYRYGRYDVNICDP